MHALSCEVRADVGARSSKLAPAGTEWTRKMSDRELLSMNVNQDGRVTPVCAGCAWCCELSRGSVGAILCALSQETGNGHCCI
jgi:hypothetical protein